MGFKDAPVERRRAVYICDQCRVREQVFYDSPDMDWAVHTVPLEHDWRLLPPYGPEPLAFCSETCLVAHHAGIVQRAYGPEAAKVP